MFLNINSTINTGIQWLAAYDYLFWIRSFLLGFLRKHKSNKTASTWILNQVFQLKQFSRSVWVFESCLSDLHDVVNGSTWHGIDILPRPLQTKRTMQNCTRNDCCVNRMNYGHKKIASLFFHINRVVSSVLKWSFHSICIQKTLKKTIIIGYPHTFLIFRLPTLWNIVA